MKRLLSICFCMALLVLALPLAGMAAQDMRAQEVAAELQKDGTKWIIIDVRTPAEFAEGHIKNAHNIDILSKDFEKHLATLKVDKSYLVYCRTGNRSTKAVEKMEKMGFKKIVHMKDGMQGWTKAQLPTVTPATK